ncbi:MAG: RAMP superfamily CRISPR-associated protein [Cyanobacteriota bacterium]|nr:RAMP superfamily CRISPR-associated protein [Cyanobacteriota bacterium]
MTNGRLNRHQRQIIKRIIIRGKLILDTPTCLGSGDAEGPTDLMLMRDSITPHALLTGTSIAGALRNYLHDYENGYGKEEKSDSLTTYLFGAKQKDENGDQSPLIINDSISSEMPKVELRDGVKINSITGIAEDKAKYDLEFLVEGTEFPLAFELIVEKDKHQDENRLLSALTIILEGLKNGEIRIGMKKRRGFGRCYVSDWQIWQFDLKKSQDRIAWLKFDREYISNFQEYKISNLVKQEQKELNTKNFPDKRQTFTMEVTFKLVGSLLIRSSQFSDEAVPDVVHLKSSRNGKEENILSGTSLAGVLRHRAEKIVKTVGNNQKIIKDIFGTEKDNENPNSSRLLVEESVIKNVNELVQNRIAIDRFTGGAFHGALFDEQPIFAKEENGKEETCVTLNLELRQPKDAEIGLLLLLLKDLWASDLPVGSESSIGRGRLAGIIAEMSLKISGKDKKTWMISQNGERLKISNAKKLESFVYSFVKEVQEGFNQVKS